MQWKRVQNAIFYTYKCYKLTKTLLQNCEYFTKIICAFRKILFLLADKGRICYNSYNWIGV